MDKGKIKNFAIKARRDLINSVEQRLRSYGITDENIASELPISTQEIKYYTDEKHALTGKQITWRSDIVNELKSRGYDKDPKQAYSDFVEEVAYTWFNRIIAIRFMEVNNYLPTRVRVLSSEMGRAEPDIINEALYLKDDLGNFTPEEEQVITEAQSTKMPAKMDKAYEILFIKQCDALAEILPGLFEPTKDYLKLLFTPNYSHGVIKDLVTQIPESYFDVKDEGQVQIIGWMYEYYISEPHDRVVNMNGSAVKKDDIPAATQLFTPDWIVKYMVDNSLGKYYLERHPDSDLKNHLKYLLPGEIDTAEDEGIENYKFIDNAMGSGHILVYAFDLFMEMYEDEGYSRRDAASKILENNLYGLEIDLRAYQLAYFAIMMKAREYDRRIFRRNVHLNLYQFKDLNITDEFYDQIEDANAKQKLKDVLANLSNAEELGSIIKVNASSDEIDSLIQVVKNLQADDSEHALDLFGNKKVLYGLQVLKVLTDKYQIVVTNPPYLNKYDPTLKKYLNKNYKAYSKDLFSVFIYNNLSWLTSDGYAGYMAPWAWMFIKTYEPLRKYILDSHKIDSLIQLEYSSYEEATVPIDTFVLKNSAKDMVGNYIRLTDFKGGMTVQEQKVLDAVANPQAQYVYHADQSNFEKIPGSPIAYWASENVVSIFENYPAISDKFYSKKGLDTGENNKFYRFWFEVDNTKDYWIPLNKGGKFRKWYGNQEYVIFWKDNGWAIKNNGKANIRNEKFYFKPSITWSDVTSGSFSCRLTPTGFIFDATGPSIYGENLEGLIGYLNSCVFNSLTKLTMPTIHYTNGQVAKMPFSMGNEESTNLSKENIEISKNDWDSFEISWNFSNNPLLIENATTLRDAFNLWNEKTKTAFKHLQSNEEKINKIYIDLFNLKQELSYKVDEKDVTMSKADRERDIKDLLSYFIGCTFGRYSLDEDGLIYAGGEWDASKYTTYKPNHNNLIMLTDTQYFSDSRDIIVRLEEFLKDTFSVDSLQDNMNFIAESLDKTKYDRGVEAEEIIRNYFINDFFKDHDKKYSKRPIYWEFNSGRNKAFKALMYLHRYTTDELAMVRQNLHDLQGAMNTRKEFTQQLLDQETVASKKSAYRRTVTKLNKQLDEIVKYDQVLDHLSQSPVELDLDDGVLVNHKKLEQGEKLLSKL